MKHYTFLLVLALVSCSEAKPLPDDVTGLGAKSILPADTELQATMQGLRPQIARDTAINVSGKPTLPDLPPAQAHTPIKLDDIANAYQQAGTPALPQKGDLIVFVSLGMPREKLRTLLAQTVEAGGVAVLRGVPDGGLPALRDFMQGLNLPKLSLQLDPPAFTRFAIDRVPGFVVAAPSHGVETPLNGCAPARSYGAVLGDISVEFALNEIRRRAEPKIQAIARAYLDSIKERP